MLRCPKVGTKPYLMASLQEPCFQSRHLTYFMMLTVPQLIVFVIGLPLAGTIHIKHNLHRLKEKQFYTRYGLLYLGYRKERAWWESRFNLFMFIVT